MSKSKKSQSYMVVWEIEIDASSPQEAVREAWDIMHDPASLANCFDVHREGFNVDHVDYKSHLGAFMVIQCRGGIKVKKVAQE